MPSLQVKLLDSVVSLTALHHANLPKAKAEIERVAKPNAGIAISFLKQAKSFPLAKRLFSNFKEFDSEKDKVFVRQ